MSKVLVRSKSVDESTKQKRKNESPAKTSHSENTNKGISFTASNGHTPGKKLQRTKSEIKLEKKKILFNKLKSVHEVKASLFSSSSGFDNYRGIINLCLLLLVLSNFRVALDNVLRYGVLVNPNLVFVFLEDPYSWPCATMVVASNIFIQICFYVEKLLSKGYISEEMGFRLHVVNILAVLVFPIAVVLIFKPQPWFATAALGWYTVLFLKFISYASVNWWCREEKILKRTKDPDLKPVGPVVYPNNLTQKDLYYFILAPTYCYELNFARTTKICKRFLLRRIVEAIFLTALIFALGQQWIVPTVRNSLKPFQDMEWGRLIERIMKLAIPNHFLWLMFFYAYFHSICNIVAELLYFGDRTFYKDWWNAPNVQTFWSNWNIPIHRFAKRHIYEPMLRNNYSKLQASLFVFFVSAFFHEFLVSVPLRMLKPYAFLSMLMQIPLAVVTHYMKNPWGNICMWLSLILGQPLAIMMYYHDYLIAHNLIDVTTD